MFLEILIFKVFQLIPDVEQVCPDQGAGLQLIPLRDGVDDFLVALIVLVQVEIKRFQPSGF